MHPSLSRLQLTHWALVVAATVAAALSGVVGAGGVFLGGGVIGLSVFLYAVGLRVLVLRGRSRLAIGLSFAKLAAFLGLAWLILASGREKRPDPVGFAIGLTCFPAAAVWEAMRVREG